MKPANPSLIDIISPPANPWLQTILNGKAETIPAWVQVVRFSDKEEDESAPAALSDKAGSASNSHLQG